VALSETLTCREKGESTVSVGVPLKTPEELMVMPAGNPEVTLQM
jgi:hypothetical protein